MTDKEKTMAEIAKYAPEIELLTRALMHLAPSKVPDPGYDEERNEILRRLRVLLELP
jgi:hypothetical protein